MNHVPPVRRLLTVLLGYVAAALVAGVLPIGGYVLLARIAYGPATALSLLPSAVLAFFRLAGISLLPAVIIIALTERFSIRAVFAYVLLGAAILVGCTIYLLTCAGLGFNFAVLSGMTSAGILAGVVYWQIAGRDAGAWRGLGARS